MKRFRSITLAALVSATLTSAAVYLPHRGRVREAAQLREEINRLRLEASRRQQRLAAAETTRQPAEAAPLAALQAFAVACNGGDIVAVAAALHFDAEARQKTQAFMANLPEGLRGKWGTPEELAADLLVSGAIGSPYPASKVIETVHGQSLGEGRVVLLLPGARHGRFEFQETAGGWKYVITAAMVDDYLRRMAKAAAAP